VFISLNVEPETREAAVAALHALHEELEAKGAPVKEGWWGYRLLVVDDLDGNQLFFNFPNEMASGKIARDEAQSSILAGRRDDGGGVTLRFREIFERLPHSRLLGDLRRARGHLLSDVMLWFTAALAFCPHLVSSDQNVRSPVRSKGPCSGWLCCSRFSPDRGSYSQMWHSDSLCCHLIGMV
jgi:hypothetical protein